jgi:hypothetical protein
MSIAYIIENPGGTKEQYEQVRKELGLTGSQLPPGQLVHIAGASDGGWVVVNVWESREAAEKYNTEKRIPARTKAGLANTPPKIVEVHNLLK